jgi:hypothetical protein
METKSIEKKLRKYSVEQLVEIPLEWEDGTMQWGAVPAHKLGSSRLLPL